MLTREDLIGLGIQPGPIFAKIFKSVKESSSKEDALAIAKAIQAGTFVPERKESVVFVRGSVWWWLKKHPSMQDLSGSELRRMISEGAVRLN